MAFLINAYNAFTVEKILTRYPGHQVDLGLRQGLRQSLQGPVLHAARPADSTSTSIEHEILRKDGVYDEPRVHFAVNCASIGCPMLREEAYVAERARARSSRSRRCASCPTARATATAQRQARGLEDLRLVQARTSSRGERSTSRRYADAARRRRRASARGRDSRPPLAFLDYDWALNDARELSIVVPALNEAARHPRRARGARAAARARPRGDRRRRRQRRRHGASSRAPLCDRVIVAPRGRALQMNAGARAADGRCAAVPARRHALCLPDAADVDRSMRLQSHVWGRFDVEIDGRHPLLKVVACVDEPALAPHRHRHRRPGDLRAARRVSRVSRRSR